MSGVGTTSFESELGRTPAAPHGLSRSALVFYAIALCVTALGYSFFTNHIWEDALITLRSAENLVNGEGLTYHAGTRVHTFTSPINVLMLALCYLLTGKGSYVATLWLYRVFSIAAFAGSGVLLLQAAARAAPRWPISLWWLGAVYLFDAKSVAYSTNGMETAYLLLFVAWAVYLLSPPQPERWLARGLCWAGLMWARPDGCIYIAALACAEFLFGGSPRRPLIRSLAKSAAICAAVYGPWFLWAWNYYGSPIPNTIVAKSDASGIVPQVWRLMDNFTELFFGRAAMVFRQVYPHAGFLVDSIAIQRLIDGTTKCMGILCAVYWLFPVNDRLGKMTSFVFALLCVYFGFQLFAFPWYLPPAALLGFTTIARASATFAAMDKPNAWLKRRTRNKVLAALLAALALGQVALFALTTWEMKIQQAEVETGTRTQLGLWLREHGKPTDTVYLEPLGYIGYFSGMTMHDYPGLVSPTVVQLRREKHIDGFDLIPELMPDWVVLRHHEFQDLLNSPSRPWFLDRYEFVQEFNALPRIEKYAFLPGKAYILSDVRFGVFHRKSQTPVP